MRVGPNASAAVERVRLDRVRTWARDGIWTRRAEDAMVEAVESRGGTVGGRKGVLVVVLDSRRGWPCWELRGWVDKTGSMEKAELAGFLPS